MHQLPAGQRAKKQTVSAARSPRALSSWLIGGLIFAADQLTKAFIVSALAPGESRPLIPNLLHLTHVQNTGAAFGLFKGRQLLFIVLTIGVILWLLRELRRPSLPRAMRWGCALVVGGAAGNLLDRWRLGYVVDFIDLRVWPVFNVGDSAITVGIALLCLRSLRAARQSKVS